MGRHRHLGRYRGVAFDAFDDFPLCLLATCDVVESFCHRRVHALVTHLLQSSLLRTRGILKRVLLRPELLLLDQIVTVLNQTDNDVVVTSSVVILMIDCCGGASHMRCWLATLIDGRADRASGAFCNVLRLVDDDRRLYSVAHVLLKLARVSWLVVVIHTTTSTGHNSLLGLTGSQFLLSTLEASDRDHVGCVAFVMSLLGGSRALSSVRILKLQGGFGVVRIVGLDVLSVEAGEVAEGTVLLGFVSNLLDVVASNVVTLSHLISKLVHSLLLLCLGVFFYRCGVHSLSHMLAHFLIIKYYFQLFNKFI